MCGAYMSEETKTVFATVALKVMRYRLTAHTQKLVQNTFQKREIIIGSHPDCDFCVNNPSISRHHAKIELDQTGFRLVDLESKNGTYIGDLRIHDIYLNDRTTFRCADIQIDFDIVGKDKDAVEVDISNENHFGKLLGDSVAMREIFGLLSRVSNTDATVLIQGEPGSGKELVANAIWSNSKRADKPYVIFDCSTVSRELVESELFGHLKGSFTGAVTNRKGAFLEADGGTIFLDEIGELPLELQPKLLRVLENRTIRPIGSEKSYPINVRIIAATNKNLAREVEQGNFREDLYYRLAVITIAVPPLRKRPEDIPLLVEHFLKQLAEEKNYPPASVSFSTLQKLKSYAWPGNVRELRNFVERASVLSSSNRIETRFLNASALEENSNRIRNEESSFIASSLKDVIDKRVPFKEAKQLVTDTFEQQYMTHVLEICKGNVSAAARFSSLNRKSVEYIINKHECLRNFRETTDSADDSDM
jgi:DNA-binding NtrC family response regulator